MKSYKNYVLIRRPAEKEATSSGIITINNNASEQIVKATVVSMYSKDQLEGIKEGDTVYVERRHALNVEGDKELYCVEPKYIALTE